MSKRYCDHEFHVIKLAEEIGGVPATLVCIYCGQVKTLSLKGEVRLVLGEGEIIKNGEETRA